MDLREIIFQGIGLKVGLTVLLLTFIVTVPTVYLGVQRVRNEATNETFALAENIGTIVGTALHDAMLRNDPTSIENILKKTVTIPLVERISILNPEGKTYLCSASEFVGRAQYNEEVMEVNRRKGVFQHLVEETPGEVSILRVSPIGNEPGCQICHGSEPIIGHLTISISGKEIAAAIKSGNARLITRSFNQAIVIIVGLSLGVILFLQRKILRALSLAQDFARKGDLTVKFDTKGGDELAHLNRSIQRMVDYTKDMGTIAQEIAQGNLTVEVKPRSEKDIFAHSFQEMVYNLRSLVEEIRSGASKVAEASKSFTSVTDQSTETMTQLAGSVSQISKAATQVSQAAQTASLAAQQTLTSANTGKNTLEKAVSKMSVIRSTADSTAQVIEELGERSGQVGDIVKVITRIADQTNLLSLNAAIEAARAGEAGRGFAVVADEVRKLAEDSANSAAKISQLVGEIQEKTVKAVEMTNQTTKEVKEGVIITSESEKKFFEIVQAAQNIANQIESIAAAAEETAASTEESSAASEEQAAGIEELSASAQNLLHTAEQLRELVTKFKV